MQRYYRPQAVKHMSIRKDPEHDIVSSRIVDKGSLRVDKEDIRDPNFLHQTAIKRHTLVGAAGEGQTLILPVMSQIQGHGEVHINFRDAVQALHLNIHSNRDCRTSKCWPHGEVMVIYFEQVFCLHFARFRHIWRLL